MADNKSEEHRPHPCREASGRRRNTIVIGWEYQRRQTGPVARRARPFVLMVAFASAIGLLAGFLGSLALPSPAWAAPSASPDAGTAQVDGRVSAILPLGDRVYLGGEFTSVNGVPRDRLAAVDATTGRLLDWAPRADGRVTALAASPDGSRVYASGSFTRINGLSRWRLASLDAATGALDPNWRPRADSGVHALAVSGNRLYVGGSFATIDGQARSRLALLDRTTGALDPNWKPSANGTVQALARSADGGRVYAGGDFTSISGQPRPYLASLDAVGSGALDGAFAPPNPNGKVFDLAVSGGQIYTAEGGPGGATASYDAATGARAWQQIADGDSQAIAVADGKVYVAGHFEAICGPEGATSINGTTVCITATARYAFSAFDPATGALDSQWAPKAQPVGVNAWELASDARRGRIYTGGDFTGVSGRVHHRFAQFSDPLVDTTAPAVGGVSPADGSANVALDANAEAAFSEAMDPSTVTDSTFTLTRQGATAPVAAAVSYDGASKKAVLDPARDLEASSAYTATIKGGPNGAKDLAGNPLAEDKAWSFTMAAPTDTKPPETTIYNGPSGTVNSASATFVFDSDEQDSSTFECSLDGEAFGGCASPKEYTGLSDGAHAFRVRATDAAGNADPTPAERTWTVDTTAPTVQAATPQDGAANVPVGVDVGAAFSEAVDGATLGDGTFALFREGVATPVSATVSYDPVDKKAVLNPGADLDQGATYTATVKGGPGGVTDSVGNPLATDEVWSFTTAAAPPTDTTPPETTIDSGPSGAVNGVSASFAFSSSEAGSTFECSLDGEAFVGCASPKEYTGLSDGAHAFRVRATDAAGNTDPTPAERSFTQKTRNVLAFDGMDDWVSVRSSSYLNLSPSTQRTYEAWIKTGPDTNARQFLYEQGGESNGFSVEVSGGRLYFNAWSVTNGWRTVYADAPVSPNTVYRVAGVYHAPSGEVRLYLDGALADTSAGAGSMPQHSDGVALGGISGSTRDHDHKIVRTGSNYGGRLGEFRAWDNARTQDRIAGEMERDLSGGEAGLIVLYELGEGGGTVLRDSGPRKLDGTISGAAWNTATYYPPG